MSLESIPCDLYVDITGDDCSAPLSKLSDAVAALSSAQTLLAVSSEQGSQSDIPAYCKQHNLQLAEQGKAEGRYYFLIRLQGQ